LGRKRGGDGLRRDLQVLVNCQATLLTERRKHQPYGLIGGDPGQSGLNSLSRGEDTILLKGKGTVELQPGDIISIQTPGGGGYGFIKG
jgi:N-methylhydantoinase B/oxoprolinase/acetone carboxylase alpha subunit